ncbi:MAG: stage III sporulation protein AF [Peptococcaceae bacterium]|nr:stage III sporulation protein AF [Peptococcaceae bacterium]
MDLIRTVMLNVIVIVFLTTILDILLPEGTMRRYVKMTMGFFVVMTLLQPVMQILHPEGLIQQWTLAVPETAQSTLAVQGEMYDLQQRQIDQMYQETVNQQITSLLLLSTELENFSVNCVLEERCLKQIQIEAVAGESLDTDRISKALSGYYGLPASQIIITVGEETNNALE